MHAIKGLLAEAIVPRAPLQRFGIVLIVIATVLFCFGWIGHDGESRWAFAQAIHGPNRWYDQTARLALWIAPIGAALWFAYPLLARVARWVRLG